MVGRPATIIVRFQQAGFHCWPGAPAHRAYLASSHRHMFHVEVSLAVTEDDREIEFHDLRDAASGMFERLGQYGEFGPQSCEMLARALANAVAGRYSRPAVASVTEDGEFGATVQSD